MRILLSLLTCLLCSLILAAQLPGTQVYVFDVTEGDSTVAFTKPQYLTAFNQRGYNNQPHWLDRNVLLLSVQQPEMQQPDIFRFDLRIRPG
jgi:hypothetical protein